MGIFSETEVEEAFLKLHDALNLSARTTDWSHFGECLTDDCTFHESVLGELGKREAIVREISKVMHQTGDTPWVRLNRFPLEDYSIDHRDAVWSIWNGRFTNPGDGSVHESRIFLLAKYYGKGKFYWMKTVYNPNLFKHKMESWKEAKAAWDATAPERLKMLAAREAEATKMAPLKLGKPKKKKSAPAKKKKAATGKKK